MHSVYAPALTAFIQGCHFQRLSGSQEMDAVQANVVDLAGLPIREASDSDEFEQLLLTNCNAPVSASGESLSSIEIQALVMKRLSPRYGACVDFSRCLVASVMVGYQPSPV